MICSKFRFGICLVSLLFCNAAFAQWEAPSDYYSDATGTGTTLKSQLTSAMSADHIQRTYGDFRFSAAITDRDPENSSNILLVYNGQTNSGVWDSAVTWNREHVWPQSLQPGSVNNSSTGNLGDPHALRPSNVGVNSDRGSMPFGFGDTTGSFGDLGSYWFPGNTCRGDIARSLFYSETRWSSLGLELVNGLPSGNEMGDLASLIEWHYLDPPDDFERRRNHTIFSSKFNPQYYTQNRNAYIDRPEFVWSIYVDQRNDSTITVAGGTSNPDGSSVRTIDYGSVIVGADISTSETVGLNKAGNDGTYYIIEAFDNAMTDAEGRAAFRTNGTDSDSINVSLEYDSSTVGTYDGLIRIDNLDITTQGGIGNGANDANDFIGLSLSVLEHSNASFSGDLDMDFFLVDLGEIEIGEPIPTVELAIHNLVSQAGTPLTASLDQISVDTLPSSFLSYSGAEFTNLIAGQSNDFSIEGTPDELGSGTTEFRFNLSDESIPGATPQMLRLFVEYDVVASNVLLGDVNGNGVVDFFDISPFIGILSTNAFLEEADLNEDGVVSFLDISPFIQLLSAAQ